MLSQKQLFLQHIGQTSPTPLAIEIEKAEGIYLFDKQGKKYIDMVSGVSVSNLGHANKRIIKAVKKQVETYMHLMVYGEFIQAPQVEYARLLTSKLPENLESVYFVNSGSEANEGAIKLAKRYTGKYEVIACKNAYHGSTQSLMALMSNKQFSQAFRPLMPGVKHIEFNNEQDLKQISNKTACVIVEPIQGEAGILTPKNNYLQKLRKRCNDTGTLLILDEIQTGFGRTGSLFAFEKYGISPDILTIAKAMGGGMPIGAFVSSKKIMNSLTFNPALGHITTFGGHPVSAAAALESLKILSENNFINEIDKKGKFIISKLKHKEIKSCRGTGLYYSVELNSAEKADRFISTAVDNGIISDRFLYNNARFRISPPLSISYDGLQEIADAILKTCDEI